MAADEVYEFTIATPAGTLQASPLVTATVIPSRIVERIEWRVPAGSMGVMGWRISMRNVPVIPRNAGGWIIAHSTSGGWPLENQPDSGDWSVTTYNTGAFNHTLYVTLHARVRRPLPAALVLADVSDLAGEPSPGYVGV